MEGCIVQKKKMFIAGIFGLLCKPSSEVRENYMNQIVTKELWIRAKRSMEAHREQAKEEPRKGWTPSPTLTIVLLM